MVRITHISDSAKRYLADRQSLPQSKVSLSDKIKIPDSPSTRIKDTKGNLTFQMDICRDGVQEYMADEIYDADTLSENGVDSDTILRVWRPPNVVFSPGSVAAHDGLPLTKEHPADFVEDNSRAYLEKGINRGSFYNKDKATISGTGFVTDALMVGEIESGEYNEISDGYDSELDFKPGVVPENIGGMPCTDSGADYDLIMEGYAPNHIAIVKEGRAGNARIHDNNKNGGKPMAGFMKKMAEKKNKAKVKDSIKALGASQVLRMLADEEVDEEKKEVLDAMAEDAEDELNENTNLSNSETKDGDADQTEEEIGEQKRVIDSLKKLKDARVLLADGKIRDSIDAEITEVEAKLADSADTGKKTTEVLNMDINKKELAELISVTVNDAMDKRLGDAGKDITLDNEPTVVEEFEVDDGFGADMSGSENMDMGGDPTVVDEFPVEGADMGGEIDAEGLYNLAKNSQDPALASLLRAAAQKMEGAAAEVQTEEMAEGEDEGFESDISEDMQVDAPEATEEARLESAAAGDPPESGTPSNQATEAELAAATKDGDKEKDIVTEKDGYFIPNKLADAAKLPVLMGSVLDTVSSYGLKDIDAKAHLTDGTIYHRLIDASGIGKITASKGITEDRVNMAINAIRANRPLVDGMSDLVGKKLTDSGSKAGFSPADEL